MGSQSPIDFVGNEQQQFRDLSQQRNSDSHQLIDLSQHRSPERLVLSPDSQPVVNARPGSFSNYSVPHLPIPCAPPTGFLLDLPQDLHSRSSSIQAKIDVGTMALIEVKRAEHIELESQTGKGRCEKAKDKWGKVKRMMKARNIDKELKQLKNKWTSLSAEFKAIRDWNAKSGNSQYFSMEKEDRKESDLPVDFPRGQLFGK
ncbi:hypothetical protein R1sor_021578 [Riccia sorocarpa]|uniref:Myb/SANT-like DNA-binding domain-containing protein n=1 Tax=Riccia sorocarpa TaxID=122646 RepID=A0ABD3GKF3_9MARC